MPDKSMNVFTEEVMDELDKIIDHVAGDEAVKGAVITSGKETFSGGADTHHAAAAARHARRGEGERSRQGGELLFDNAGRMSWLWRKLETSGKPWVSAINGTWAVPSSCRVAAAASPPTATRSSCRR